jgi:hypothetical protein
MLPDTFSVELRARTAPHPWSKEFVSPFWKHHPLSWWFSGVWKCCLSQLWFIFA